MKAYFARKKADGKFLNKGRTMYFSTLDDKNFPDYWTRLGSLRACVTNKNSQQKRYNAALTPIDLAKDFDIIEVDLSLALRAEVDKLEAIEKALLFGGTS